MSNDHDLLAERVIDIGQTVLPEDDGVVFLHDTSTIREDAEYSGVRVAMDCQVATARIKLRLDVNAGDPVTPAPSIVHLESRRPDLPGIRLLGYPIETVLAEKLSTAITLGDTNTKVRDYADVYMLTSRHSLRRSAVREALVATSEYRDAEIVPLSEVVGTWPPCASGRTRASGPGSNPTAGCQSTSARSSTGVVAFADGLVEGGGQVWEPGARKWV